jgi:hypothetical protein
VTGFQSKLNSGADACHPSYLGGRDQEDCGSKPAWANSLRDPFSNKTHHKERLVGAAQVVECLSSKREAQSLNPSTAKKQNKKLNSKINNLIKN